MNALRTRYGTGHDKKFQQESARYEYARRLGWNPSQTFESITGRPPRPSVARIINGNPTRAYKAVGQVGSVGDGGFCSGTLIGSRYVLTAGHGAIGLGDKQGIFKVDRKTYRTSRVTLHPKYNDDTLDNDIAIFELDRDVKGVAPIEIFRGKPKVGQELTLVGFGAGGTGTSGSNGDFGTKRVGTTAIDGVTSDLIYWNFDDNTESNTAPGDSGGPAFLTVNGKLFLAGVTSGGEKDDSGIGDFSFDTRVDSYKTWIDSIVRAGGGSGGSGSGGSGSGGSGSGGSGNGGSGNGGSGNAPDDHANTLNVKSTLLQFNGKRIARDIGTLEKNSDRDVFRFKMTDPGQVIVNLKAVGNQLNTDLRIFNAKGRLLTRNDNRSGRTTDSQIVRNLGKGTFYLAVNSSAKASRGKYRLTVRQAGSVANGGDDHGNTFAQATARRLNAAGKLFSKARIETGTDQDVFRLTAKASGKTRINVTRLSGTLDTVVHLYSANRKRITSNDDFGNGTNSRVEFNAQAGRSYYLKVSGDKGTKGDFRLQTRRVPTTRRSSVDLTMESIPGLRNSDAGASALTMPDRVGKTAGNRLADLSQRLALDLNSNRADRVMAAGNARMAATDLASSSKQASCAEGFLV